MKIAFNPSTVAALTAPPNNKDITFDLRGRNIFARGVKFYGTDTNTWRDIKINNVSIGSHTLDLRNGSNTALTNTNGIVTINSTWRPVVDNLTSDSTTSSLSAKQGKVLKALIDGKSNSDHNHDGRYVRKSGDTMSGVLIIDTTNFGALAIKRSDDVNGASIQFRGKSNIYGYIGFNAANRNKQLLRWNGTGSQVYTILDTSSTYISGGKGVINGTTITQVDNADKLDGFHATSGNNKPWGTIPAITTNGWMDVGRQFEFHYDNSTGSDYSTLLRCTGNYSNIVELPAESGTLALTSQVLTWKSQIIDMRNYSGSYWHPVTVPLPYTGYNKIKVSVQLNSGDKPSWAEHSSGITCNMEIWATASGWGTTNSETICLNYTYKQCSQNPCGWMQLGYPSLGVLFLRGGSRYRVYTDFDATFTSHDQKYTWTNGSYSQNTGGPYTSCPGLNFNKNKIYANLDGYASRLEGGSIPGWGTLTAANGFTNVSSYDYGSNGAYGLCGKNSALYMQLDGYFYQNKGKYRVLDTSDLSSVTNHIMVSQYTTGDTNYPLVWSNQSNTNSAVGNQLYKSWADLYYNPKNKRLYTNRYVGNYANLTQTSMRHIDADLNSKNTDHTLYIGYGAQTYTAGTNIYASTGSGDTTNARYLLAQFNTSAGINLNGNINTRPSIIFRNEASYKTTLSYSTAGNEALCFETKNAVTSIIFYNGATYAATSNHWYDIINGVQIKNNCLAIGAGWANGVNPNYKLKVGGNSYFAGHLIANNAPSSWLDGQRYNQAGYNLQDASGTGDYYPWMRQTNTGSAKWFSIGILNNSFYILGSKTSRTENSYDYAWRFDLSNGWAYGNFSNADTTDGVHINWSGTNDNPTYLASWDNDGKAIRAATRANVTVGNSDKLDGYHENSFLRYRGVTNKDQEATLWSQIGIKEYQKALPDGLTGVYNFGNVISLPGLYSRFEIYTSHQSSTGNGLYYRSGWVNDKQPWRKFIDSSNIGSQSVNYANSAGSASSADRTRALKYTGTGSSEITAHQTEASYMGRSGWASYIICNHGNGSTYYSQTIAMPFWGSPIYRRLEGGTDKGWKKFYTEEAPPSWNNITNKPSTFTPAAHTHTWASITDKIVAGNEFNIVNAGFKGSIWFNYLPINDRSKTATILSYHFGNGAKGYASVAASGFAKIGSNNSYVLLGDGGHKTISSLSVNYANSAGSATKASYVTLTYCRDDSSPSNKGLWNTIKNGTSSAQTNKVNFYTIYNSAGGPSGHGEMMEILSYNANYWQPQLWFGAGKTGGIYYRNKSYNDNTWGSWQTVAFTSQLKDPVNYYWANVKISASSSTGTSPTFSAAYTSNWFRSSGSTGWYSQTYGGGIYMTDATWIRAYGNKGIVAKNFYASNWASATYLLRSDGGAAAFNWSGQSGQPTWLWGGNSQHSYYVYNPSNFSVKYAASAGAVAWGNVTGRPSSLKNPYSLNVFGVAYDGSVAKTVTTSTFISQVNEATSTITDGTMLITSYASNSGFADTNAVNVPYKRKAVHLWDYIDGKVSTKYLPLAGGTMNANARISHGNGNLYIGRADNNGWVYTQDIASHAGTDKWSIRTSGAARFGSIYIASKTDTSFNSNVIECTSSMHLNHFSSQDVSLCNGGGKVGIGKSDPLYKLDVAGSGRFQDFVYCNTVYSNTLNHTSPTGYLIIGNKTKEISIRSSYLPDVPAVYLYQKFSTNVYYTANKGFGIRPYYLSSMYYRPIETISGNTYSVVTVGDSVQAISCIIADKANIIPQIRGTLIRFLPGDDGQIVLLKDLNNYGATNGYFYVQPKGCNIIRSNNSNIHIADGNISDACDDGKSRFFIYAKTHKVWIEFYCG